jgi:hypothetical protein
MSKKIVPADIAEEIVEKREGIDISKDDKSDLWIWDKLHWFYFPDLVERPASQDEHLQERILPSVNYNDHKPTYVYMHNGRMDELESINHTPEVVEHLNETGVTFYLNEPLCMYDSSSLMSEHTLTFYSEFNGKEKPENIRSDELNCIRDYITRNNLTNVKVKTCDYKSEKMFPYYSEWMTITCEDTFVKNSPYVNILDDSYDSGNLLGKASKNFTKKFINLNWRWAPHRNLIAAFLANSEADISFVFKTELERLQILPWFDIRKCPKKYRKRLYEGIYKIDNDGPLNVDVVFEELLDIEKTPYPVNTTIDEHFDPSVDEALNLENEDVHHTGVWPIEKYYKDIFCDVVTESRFAQPTPNYSEKVQQPMWFRKPFILMAPPGTLKYLHEHGYKTFSDFWDESYDDCTDHEKRLYKIFEIIKYIESKTITELKDIYRDMRPILDHNRIHVEKSIYQWRGDK